MSNVEVTSALESTATLAMTALVIEHGYGESDLEQLVQNALENAA